MEWTPSLTNLAQKARRVSIAGPFQNCYLLRILLAINDKECTDYDVGQLEHEALVPRVVERTGLVEPTVARYCRLTISHDLQDWHDYHERAFRFYRTSKWQDSYVMDWLADTPPGVLPPDKTFVLRNWIWTWHPEHPSIGHLWLEEEDPIHQFPLALEGYLIAHGMAYSTTVHMLEAASNEKWNQWEALWGLL